MATARLKSLAFELGAEIPECERGIGLALQRLRRQERRGAVDDGRLPLEVETGAARKRLQQQPALVERAAGNGELSALEIGDVADRRLRWHHHGAERAGRGVEYQAIAQGTLARNPEPVRKHEIDRAAFERDLAGFGRGEFERFDREARLAVEAVRLDDIHFPRQRAGPLHREANALGGVCAGTEERHNGDEGEAQIGRHDITLIRKRGDPEGGFAA